MPYIQHFELEGVDFGTAERTIELRTRAGPYGVAFFCPTCGRIWARCAVDGRPWSVSHSLCADCGRVSVLDVPGSMWRALDHDFNNALPRTLLLREFELALAYNTHLESRGIDWNSQSSVPEAVHGVLAAGG